MKTSVLLGQNIRTFAQRSPMFCIFRTATSHSPFPHLKKKFLKISYISYTTAPDALYLLTISGEGQGVGYSRRVQDLYRCRRHNLLIPPHFARNYATHSGTKARNETDEEGTKCRISYTLRLYPTPYPSPEIPWKHYNFRLRVQEMQEISTKLF